MAAQAPRPEFIIEKLSARHDRRAFVCGVEALDAYLRRQAGQDGRRHAAVLFVATRDGTAIGGYYTLSQFAVHLDAIPDAVAKKLPKYPMVPATLLGRLAVSAEFRSQGLGETLLMDALRRCLILSHEVASAAVVVDAKNDSAVSFYRKYGFLQLPQIPHRLFLPMGTIAELFG